MCIFKLPQTYSNYKEQLLMYLYKKYLLIQEKRENTMTITLVNLIADKEKLKQE